MRRKIKLIGHLIRLNDVITNILEGKVQGRRKTQHLILPRHKSTGDMRILQSSQKNMPMTDRHCYNDNALSFGDDEDSRLPLICIQNETRNYHVTIIAGLTI